MSATGDDDPSRGDDPVTRAKKAGWKIDPRVEESMRQLPPTSELYDVTGKPPREVHYVAPDDPNWRVEYLPIPPEAKAEMARDLAAAKAKGMTQADIDREAASAGGDPDEPLGEWEGEGG